MQCGLRLFLLRFHLSSFIGSGLFNLFSLLRLLQLLGLCLLLLLLGMVRLGVGVGWGGG